MIVEKDMDLDNIERSGVYKGKYFVLGGTVSALEKEPERRIRIRELTTRITKEKENNVLNEIIFALSATPDGDDTAEFVHKELALLLEGSSITFSALGRGLSTGSELEYADKETIKQALERRN
jgi:recombination protein RecR